ncbi:MAG: thiamine pyridinylase, partial [Lachnospiraceae bacterium]|nr:thiamine pyridinylase [Lachnospiraceae bacterium]
LIDMTGGTTKVTMYLDALCDVNKAYTEYDEFPDTASFSEESLKLLRLLVKMGGLSQVNYWPENDDSYIRGRWFSEGKGRALIGYTEIMSVMGENAENFIFRTFSYNKEENIPLFFGDLAGINSKISEEKKEAAYDLLEILTCAETMESAILPGKSGETPQYLLPARMSVYEELGKTLPVYEKLGEIAANPENRLFKMGADVREYLAAVKKVLPGLIFE